MLLHAMLEQVARNVAGAEAVEEGEQAAAESWALDALAKAFGTFDLAEQGGVFSGGPLSPVESGSYTIVQEVRFTGSNCN